jgi:hippurate hydrolase
MKNPAIHIAKHHDELMAIRQDIHQNPEPAYKEFRTAGLVADKLKRYGVDEVHTGIGGTGVVGVIKGKGKSDAGIGLRADMDCLAMPESNTFLYASKNQGYMHACGHDGHTTMLLGAAQYLASTRNFSGSAYCIFQPAEEGMAGAAAMIKDGLFERFSMSQIYGLHNMPSVPEGKMAVKPGAMMAAADKIYITIEGKGGHGGFPHLTADPVLMAGHVITAIQSIAARNTHPLDSVVVSICGLEAGEMNTSNVLPSVVKMIGTVRTFSRETQAATRKRIEDIVAGVPAAFGGTGSVNYVYGYPPTVNSKDEALFAQAVGAEIFGADNVMKDLWPEMGAEDFSFFLEAKPGAYIWVGGGTPGCQMLHNVGYDFNDRIIPNGAGLLARLVEKAQPLEA